MSDHTWTCTHPNISVLTREDFWGQEPCKSHKSTSHVIPLATLVTIPLHSSKRLMGHLRISSFLCGWTKGKPNPKTWESWVLDCFFCSIYESLGGELALLFSQCRQESSKRGNSWAFALLMLQLDCCFIGQSHLNRILNAMLFLAPLF